MTEETNPGSAPNGQHSPRAQAQVVAPAQPPSPTSTGTSLFVGGHLAKARLGVQFGNWRLFLVHVISSGLAVTITVVALPGFWFERWFFGELLLVAVVAGVLNATVKPFLQFFALRYLIASYGLAVVLVNAAVLFLLAVILHGDIAYRGAFALLAGGLLVGILGMIFDAVLGTGTPILDTTGRNGWASDPQAGPGPTEAEGILP